MLPDRGLCLRRAPAHDRDRRADASGGKVPGGVRHPLSTQDFSSFLLQAQASKAKIIGLANAGQDTINSIKQAGEFGIVKGGQRLAGLLVFSTDVNSRQAVLIDDGISRSFCVRGQLPSAMAH